MTGRGEKSQVQEWLGQQAPHGLNGCAQGTEILPHGFKGREAHQAGERQGELGQYLAAPHGDESPAQREQTIDGDRHVLVAGAHYADVVAVMADRGGERALGENQSP